MKIPFVFSFLILASGVAFGSEPSPIIDEALLALKPAIYNLDRKIYVYHYAHLSDDPRKAVSADSSEAKDHFKNWVQYFWDRGQDEKIKGYVHGYYAALDPVKTRSYSWDGAALFMNRVELTEKVRVLDLTKTGKVSERFATFLQTQGCSAVDYPSLLQKKGGKACRDIQLEILKKANVDVLRYGYSNLVLSECLDEGRELSDETAFVILRTENIAESDVRIFSGTNEHLDMDNREERSILESIIYSFHPDPESSSLGLKVRPVSPAKVKAYKAAHLYSCRNLQTKTKR
jgi:hypothetical protein